MSCSRIISQLNVPTQQTFTQCCFNVVQRRRRWANIETAMGECLVFAGHANLPALPQIKN